MTSCGNMCRSALWRTQLCNVHDYCWQHSNLQRTNKHKASTAECWRQPNIFFPLSMPKMSLHSNIVSELGQTFVFSLDTPSHVRHQASAVWQLESPRVWPLKHTQQMLHPSIVCFPKRSAYRHATWRYVSYHLALMTVLLDFFLSHPCVQPHLVSFLCFMFQAFHNTIAHFFRQFWF